MLYGAQTALRLIKSQKYPSFFNVLVLVILKKKLLIENYTIYVKTNITINKDNTGKTIYCTITTIRDNRKSHSFGQAQVNVCLILISSECGI